MPARPVAIRAEGLWKTYVIHPPGTPRRFGRRPGVEFHALRDVSFDVPEGAVLGIVGRNGAGKSTLLKVLGRITDPSRGRVLVAGRVASLLEVGTGFHPELTGLENVYLNAAIHGLKRREVRRRLDSILGFAEIGDFLDEPVKRYSSGMYLRLAFGIAAHLDADILIVDELLAVGDAGFRERCFGKMKEVAGSGRTVVLVSHEPATLRALCTHALHLERGTLRAAGATEPVVGAYLEGLATGQPVVHVDGDALTLVGRQASCRAATPAGQEVHVELTFEVKRDVRRLRMGFSFEGPSGVRLFQCGPAPLGASPVEARVGERLRCVVACRLPPLAPGPYSATFLLEGEGGEPLLHVSGVRLFEVPPDPARPECLAPGFRAALLPAHTFELAVLR